jgi:hypothetical protein
VEIAVRKRTHNAVAERSPQRVIGSLLLVDYIPELRIINKQVSIPNMLLMVHMKDFILEMSTRHAPYLLS